MFEGTFTQAPLTASQYVEDASFKEKTLALPGAQPLETLQTVHKLIIKEKPDNFNDCVAWARLTWQELFHNSIAQLLHNFPADQVKIKLQRDSFLELLCIRLLPLAICSGQDPRGAQKS